MNMMQQSLIDWRLMPDATRQPISHKISTGNWKRKSFVTAGKTWPVNPCQPSIFYRIHLLSSLISFLSYFLFFNPLSFIPLTCNPIPFCELFVSYSHGIRLPLHSSFARESAAGRYQMQFLVLGSSCRRRFHVTESSPKEAIRELG